MVAFDDLITRPPVTSPVTLECAENTPGAGMVSHAEWTGVPLSGLIAQAQPKAGARFVRLSGVDGFSHIIPLAKAMHPGSIIAYSMNNEKLPPNHGFPLRAIIPGWYGVCSVKWIRALEVLADEETNRDYQRRVRALLGGSRAEGPVQQVNVNSTFARPLDGAILVSRRFVVRGLAWAGEAKVQKVEISVDGAKNWQTAKLDSQASPYAWVQWTYEWKIPDRGEYELTVRATDTQGRQQLADRPSNRVDPYEANVWQTVKVLVK